MNIPKVEELDSPKKKGILYIRKHYPEFCQFIQRRYPYINKFNAGIYLYYRGMEHPLCPMCGKPTPFLDETRGFQRCCSSKCANSDPSFRQRAEATNLKKYGTKVASQSKVIKDKIVATYTERHGGMGNASQSVKKKQHATMKEIYGSEYALRNDELKDKAIAAQISKHGGVGLGSKKLHDKAKQTCLKKYGADSSFKNKEVREKIKQTNIERYGVEIATQNSEVAEKLSKSKSKRFIDLHSDIINIQKIGENITYTCKCPHPECTMCTEKIYEIDSRRYCDRRLDGTEPCTKILPVIKWRIYNTYPEIFVRAVIQECTDVPLSLNDRRLIGPKELDIYDPAHGLAFECNGCYWHSDQNKSPSYHIKKYKECQTKGVQLITIWEDWIKTKPEIVRSIIRSKYHYFQRSIYGRKCVIKEVGFKEADAFLQSNHIQGSVKASIHIGLYYQDELVSLTSWSKMRGCMGSSKSREGQWELVRFCSCINTQVIGAADKLLKYFIKTYTPTSIVSFSLNDISNGSLYQRLGFEKISENKSYWYIGKEYRRYHRSNFTKNAIIKLGLAPDREHWTETEAMMEHGFVRIYDSGQTKWVLDCRYINQK